MRLQLVRLHSADQYYFSGTIFCSILNKNTKLVVAPFFGDTLKDPCMSGQVCD